MWRRIYLVLNDIMSAVLKSNKYETCQQKLTTILTNERRVNRQLFLHTCDLSLIFLILIQIIQYYLIQNIFLYNNTSLLFTTHHDTNCVILFVPLLGQNMRYPNPNSPQQRRKKEKEKKRKNLEVSTLSSSFLPDPKISKSTFGSLRRLRSSSKLDLS